MIPLLFPHFLSSLPLRRGERMRLKNSRCEFGVSVFNVHDEAMETAPG
jgi:hypothetical protein